MFYPISLCIFAAGFTYNIVDLNVFMVMVNKKKVKIDLGHGFIFEDGEVKKVLKEGQPLQEWMTWDEGWQWVISSLKRLKQEYERT